MPANNRKSPRAFTIVELLVSLLVISALMAILIVSGRAAIAYARNAADRQAAIAMRVGVIQFKTENGFFPPLTRDQYPVAGSDRARVEDIPNSSPAGLRRIAVYDINVDRYKRVLMRSIGSGDTPVDGAAWGSLTDYYDIRYSANSLAYYLIGALDERYGGPNSDMTIDGRKGLGMFSPNRDGSFKIPTELANDANATVKLPRIYEPFFVPNNSSTKLFVDSADIQNCQIRDRNDLPFRYYQWVRDDGERNNAALNKYLRVPVLVGDPLKDERLRNAKFAIVGAGPNKLFGDESLPQIIQTLGLPLEISEVQARKKAMEDNVVEFGE